MTEIKQFRDGENRGLYLQMDDDDHVTTESAAVDDALQAQEDHGVVVIEPGQGEEYTIAGPMGWKEGDYVARTKDGSYEGGERGNGMRAVGSGAQGTGHEHADAEGISTPEEAARLLLPPGFGYRLDPAPRRRPDGSYLPTDSYWIVAERSDKPENHGGKWVDRIGGGLEAQCGSSTVSDRYSLIQPSECFRFMFEALGREKALASRALVLDSGSELVISSRLTPIKSPNGGDFDRSLMFSNPNTGGGSAWGRLTGKEPTCRNLYRSLKGSAVSQFRIRHTASAAEKIRILADAFAMAESPEALANMQETLFSWGRTAMTWDNVVSVLRKHCKWENAEGSLKKGRKADLEKAQILWECAPGSDPGTIWGARQFATYWATHVLSKNKQGEQRYGEHSEEESAFLKAGARFSTDFWTGVDSFEADLNRPTQHVTVIA